MTRPSIMAICILVALALPIFTCGLPAIDHSGSASKALPVRDSKPATSSDAEQKKVAIVASPYVRRESALVPEKSRQKRQSDHRLAELETLITLSLVSNMLSQMRYKKLDPMAIAIAEPLLHLRAAMMQEEFKLRDLEVVAVVDFAVGRSYPERESILRKLRSRFRVAAANTISRIRVIDRTNTEEWRVERRQGGTKRDEEGAVAAAAAATAKRSKARQGKVRRGEAGRDKARQGGARRGGARRDEMRRGECSREARVAQW
ncbi:hypothetical protein EAI_00647 [Harpegnathos saltator]|uniref:Uncharacterized protein n=1 Tax=Harpegnathos saltator TaxID=610380 RepID=E2BCH6_HARSA|nr:hypothetical protein EAI_00647 [Harpegnathos saltator]